MKFNFGAKVNKLLNEDKDQLEKKKVKECMMIAVISFACNCLMKNILICKQIVHNFHSLHHQKTVLKSWIKSNSETTESVINALGMEVSRKVFKVSSETNKDNLVSIVKSEYLKYQLENISTSYISKKMKYKNCQKTKFYWELHIYWLASKQMTLNQQDMEEFIITGQRCIPDLFF